MKGKNAGKNPYANKTEEEMRIISNKKSNSLKGKNAGKNPFANKTPEEMEIISNKKSNSMKGKHCSDETKRKICEKLSKKVICINTGEIFDSMKEAGNYYNVTRSNITLCCREIRKSAGKLNGTKLKWKFLEDYNNEFKGILINPITDKRY